MSEKWRNDKWFTSSWNFSIIFATFLRFSSFPPCSPAAIFSSTVMVGNRA